MLSRKTLILVLVASASGLAACQSSESGSREKTPPPALASLDLQRTIPAHDRPAGNQAVAPAAAKRYSEEQIRRGECHTPWVFDPAIGGPVTDLSRWRYRTRSGRETTS
jgi:hypothetical protein